VPGDAWSKELDASKDLVGDWVDKKCGNYNTRPTSAVASSASSMSWEAAVLRRSATSGDLTRMRHSYERCAALVLSLGLVLAFAAGR